MDDLISRAAALDAIDHERDVLIEEKRLGAEHVVVHHARRLIEDLPTVDAAPVVHGRWVYEHDDPVLLPCSVCGYQVYRYNNTHYCPECGAKMDGERRENE